MKIKLVSVLILLIHLCTADIQPNGGTGTFVSVAKRRSTPDNARTVADCKSAPNQPDEQSLSINYKNSPPDTGSLLPQSLKNESQSKKQNNPVYQHGLQKALYIYEEDSNENDTKHERDNGKGESESSELRKLVEKCLTTKLRSLKANPEELLNTRRRLNDPSPEYSLGNSPQDLNENVDKNVEEQFADPTQSTGVRRLSSPNLGSNNVLSMNNRRVCYACTSANNPNCWVPNRYTTVKYCSRESTGCVTKTYNSANGLVIIRNCGTCATNSNSGIYTPVYASCSVCQSDLCNDKSGASILKSINSLSLLLGLIIIGFAKKAF